MGLVHNCSRCGAEMRPYDEVIDQPQPCRKCLNEDIERLRAIVDCCAAECPPDESLEVNERVAVHIAELEAIVDKLPKTADGVPVVPGMELWFVNEHGKASMGVTTPTFGQVSRFYSTREAALAAKEKR